MNNKRKMPLKLLLTLGFFLLSILLLAQAGRSAAGPTEVNAGPKIYWSDKEDGRIWRADLDGSRVEPVTGSLSRPEAVALNPSRNEMYVVVDEYAIEKMDFNGGNRELLVAGYPLLSRPNTLAVDQSHASLYWSDSQKPAIGQIDLDSGHIVFQLPLGPNEANGIAIDEDQGKVYWLRRGRLYQSNLDGSDTQLFTELFGLTDMALDLGANKIYFAYSLHDFYGYSVYRADLDGSNLELLADFEMGRCDGIALDLDQGKVYWTERGTTPRIMRANLDGTGTETILDKNIFGPFGLALDTAAGKLYWADWVSQRIQRANLDGSAVEDLLLTVPARPRYLALDTSAGKLYWTGDRGAAVWQADLDGSNSQPLVPGSESASTGGVSLQKGDDRLYWIDGAGEAVIGAKLNGSDVKKIVFRRLWDPQGLALDETAGKMYWADREHEQILRANMDGSAVEVLVNQGLDTPTSLALDLLRGKMAWTDPILRQINQANLDGSEVEVLLAADDGLIRPNLIALDVSAGKMYWTDYGSKSLHRADLDGTNIEDLVTSGILLPSGLALRIPPLELHHSYMPMAGSS